MQGQHNLKFKPNISTFISQAFELPIHTFTGAFLIKSTTIHSKVHHLVAKSQPVYQKATTSYSSVATGESPPLHPSRNLSSISCSMPPNQTVNVFGAMYQSKVMIAMMRIPRLLASLTQ